MLDGSSGRHGLIVVSTVMFAEGCSPGRHRRRTRPENASAVTADRLQGKKRQECSSNVCWV